MTTLNTLRTAGARQREALFGNDNSVPAGLARLLDEAVHGGIWSRPGLGTPDRMICTLAALAVFPRLRTLRRHIGAALDLGLTPLTLREIFIQAGLYAGFSVAEETIALAEEIYAARGLPLPADLDDDVTLEELSRRGRERMALLVTHFAAPGCESFTLVRRFSPQYYDKKV